MDLRYSVYWGLLCCSAIYSLIHFSRMGRAYRLLALYIVFILVSETVSRIIGYLYHNSMPVYHVEVPLQFLFYGRFFGLLPHVHKNTSRTFLLLGVCGALLCLMNSVFLQSPNIFPSNAIILLTILVIPLTLFGFRQMLLHPSTLPILRTPGFWFLSGNLIFFSLGFFIFSYYNLIGSEEWLFDVIWIANMLMYSGYFIASILESKSLKS